MKKLFSLHKFFLLLLRSCANYPLILQSDERLSMRPLSTDNPSCAFTLFYVIFSLAIRCCHFASRYFHDLNLLSYQTLIIIYHFTRMEKGAKKKGKKVGKKIAPMFKADINLDEE